MYWIPIIKPLWFLRSRIGIATRAFKRTNPSPSWRPILMVSTVKEATTLVTWSFFVEGWIRVDVTSVIKNWLMYQDSPTHAIAVACKTCGMDMQKSPISFKPSFKPFLMIRTYAPQLPVPVMRRPKRNAHNCVAGSNECCRENVYISFAEIGWDDWIIEPKGFNAYFCRGSCRTAASLTVYPSDLYSIQRVSSTNQYLNLSL